MVLGNRTSTRKRMKLDPYLTCTKINSKSIKNLNTKPEIITSLEENIVENFQMVDCENKFLNMIPKAEATKAKIDQQDYIKANEKLNHFCTEKEAINKTKG